MDDFIIMTDSCIDLPNDLAQKFELSVLPLSVQVEDKVYFNYLDEREIKIKQFYQLLRDRVKTSTSQATPAQFVEIMTPILESGKDILSISFSAALSGTYGSTLQAKDELLEKYPNRKIITIDSMCASMGQGLLITYAYRLKQEGKTIEEVARWVEDNRINVSHLFTVGDLNHLRRGGRLSPIKAIIGSFLRVKPLLHVSNEGRLTVADKARGRLSALNMIVDRMANTIINPVGQTVYISHADCEEDALYLKQLIMDKMPITDFLINYIGPVVGSHAGLGTLAVFYLGNDRHNPDE